MCVLSLVLPNGANASPAGLLFPAYGLLRSNHGSGHSDGAEGGESRKVDRLSRVRPKRSVETEGRRQGLATEDTQPSNYWEESNSHSQHS